MQQCLPFTVLKQVEYNTANADSIKLQQCLPFTVLKPFKLTKYKYNHEVATVLTVYGIETLYDRGIKSANFWVLRVATVLTVYGIETCILLRIHLFWQ